MCIWPDHIIEHFAENGGITPLNKDNINPASYDLSTSLVATTTGSHDLKSASYQFYPGEIIRCCSEEIIKLPRNVGAFLVMKSTWGRKLTFLAHTGWLDPGFEGQPVWSIMNKCLGRIELPYKVRICQLVFMEICFGGAKVPYNLKDTSHYKGSKGLSKVVEDV